MGVKPTLLPESFLRRMDPAARQPLGKAGALFTEAQARADTRAERELQRDIANACRQRNLFFIQARMDKPTTARRGLPDFFIILPGQRALAVEAKVEGGKLSADQSRVIADYWTQTGGVVHIIWNLAQFYQLLDQHAS